MSKFRSTKVGNNMENNSKQPRRIKQLGGITGAGFMPGQSGNPKGRPHTKGLLTAVRNKVAEVDASGRTIEARPVEVLVNEALDGKNPLPAVEIIFDRLEGRSRQRLEVADVTAQLRDKSEEELQFHLDNNRWPDEAELLLLGNSHEVNQHGRNTSMESEEIQEACGWTNVPVGGLNSPQQLRIRPVQPMHPPQAVQPMQPIRGTAAGEGFVFGNQRTMNVPGAPKLAQNPSLLQHGGGRYTGRSKIPTFHADTRLGPSLKTPDGLPS
jgi:hypothetical protein